MSFKDVLIDAFMKIATDVIEEKVVMMNERIEQRKREQYLKDNSMDVEFTVKN